MTTTRTLIAAALLALPLSGFADTPAGYAGTWECRRPGVDHGTTPPILFLGAAEARNAGQQTVVDVDGFARAVYGLGDLVAEAGGWWKVTPAEGPAFFIRPESTGKSGRPTMQVRRDGAVYRCHRVQPRTS